MATSTTNFGLKKIDLTDVADITVINENWDKIDEQLLKAGESGGTDLIETEAASIIEGDAPEIEPVIQTELNKLDAELTQQKSDFTELDGKALRSRDTINNITEEQLKALGTGSYRMLSSDTSVMPCRWGVLVVSDSPIEYRGYLFYGTDGNVYYRTLNFNNGSWYCGWKQISTTDMDLLWQNASPKSDFVSQSVNIPWSKYEYLLIVTGAYKSWNGSGQTYTFICDNDQSTRMSYANGAAKEMFNRRVLIYNGSLTFEEGSVDGTTDNGAIVPYRIYGVK